MLQLLIVIDTLSTFKLVTYKLPEAENKYDVQVTAYFLELIKMP